MKLEGKVVIITGAGRGIGKEIALEMAREGAKVVVNDVNTADTNQVVAEIKEMGKEAMSVIADVSQYNEVKGLISSTIEAFGTVDILVNNAGITRDNVVTRIEDKDWNLVIDINLKGSFNCIKEVFSTMKKNGGGKIINIASISAQIGNFGQGNYCASKAGVIGLTKCIATEGGQYSINVNAISPGFIDTEMTRKVPEKIRENLINTHIPMRRSGYPIDIAKACVFLGSDDANYITGQVININGGWYM